ncbi:MAG: hypothetical protein CMJ28_03895 [Phycisphaerae bacterium]|nr:hypothetical protein [Phycisphaerae bacterium]
MVHVQTDSDAEHPNSSKEGRMERRQTRGLIALFAVLNIFCWYVFTRPSSLWLADQGPHAPAPSDIMVTPAFFQSISSGRDVLDFKLSQALYPNATLEGLAIDPLFEFAPPLEGAWIATGPDQVRFDLSAPLPPAHRWTAKLIKDMSDDGRPIKLTQDVAFQSTTPNVWGISLDEMTKDAVVLELQFNQPIPPAELSERIKVTALGDNSLLPVKFNETKPNPIHLVTVPLPESGDLRVNIDQGYLGTLGPASAEQSHVSTVKLPAGLQCLDASFRGKITEGIRMVVRFSGSLKPEQPLDLLTITPAVSLTSKRIEDGRIVLRGDFEVGREYEVTLPDTLVDQWDRVHGQSATRLAKMPEWSPDLSFVHGGGILSPNGRLEVDIRTVNVPQLRWNVQKLYANNVVPFLNGSWYRQWRNTSRNIKKGLLQCDGPRNQILNHVLPLREHLQDPIGIHRIELADNARRSWQRESAVVSITDLGLLYKAERNHHSVLVHSISSTNPLTDVQVELRSATNQVLAEGITDKQGRVRLPRMKDHPDGPGFVLIAQTEKDLQFMRLSSTAWAAPDPVSGERPFPEQYECFLYPERTMYRPGEPMHYTGVIRDRIGGIPMKMPLEFIRYGADGRLISTTPVPTFNDQGIFQIKISTDRLDPTGQERHELRIPGFTTPIGTSFPFVEAFEPVRLKLETTVPPLVQKESLEIEAKVSTLFGGAATDLPVRVQGRFRPKNYSSTRFPTHNFNLIDVEREGKKLQSKPTVSDASGLAIPHLSLDEAMGYGEILLSVSATQIGGRTVSDNINTIFDPIGHHLGLESKHSNGTLDSPMEFNWVALDALDQDRITTDPEITIQRVQRDWVRRLVRNNWRWVQSTRYEDAQLAATINNDGATEEKTTRNTGTFMASFHESGEWRVLIESEGIKVARNVYITGLEGQARDPNPLLVEMQSTVEEPEAGEIVPVIIRTPAPGRLLLTIESDEVDWWHTELMTGTEMTVNIPVPNEARGSVHLLAALIRPLDQTADNWTPRRAKGHLRLPIRPSAPIQPVFTVPNDIEPEQQIVVEIHCPEAPIGTKLHVWAIDEGIARISGSAVPNPSNFFHAPRRLSVRTADRYDELLPDYDRGEETLRIGSDLQGGSGRRRSPLPFDRKSIVLWREAVTLGEDGRAALPFTMPRLNGALRFRAVAVHNDQYGAEEEVVPVVAPVGIDTTWPRAVAPGDEFRIPLRIHNRTNVRHQITWSLAGGAGLKPAVRSGVVTAQPGETIRRSVPVVAMATGVQRGTLVAESGTLRSTTDWTTTVRPATGLHVVDRSIRVSSDAPATISLVDTFYPEDLIVNIEAGGPPEISLRSSLERMLNYPYGCIEQTSSTLGTTLLLPELARAEGRDKEVGVDRLVQAGISRIHRMQTSTGAFSYWPGSMTEHIYGTGRAALILAKAEGLGYHVPVSMKDGLTTWLRTEVLGRRQPDANIRALLAHAASEWGISTEGANMLLFERKEKLSTTGKMHLIAALNNLGQMDLANQVLDGIDIESLIAKSDSARVGTWIETQTLARSMLLEHLITMRPADTRILLVLQAVRSARTRGWWGSTLDTVAATSALVKWISTQPKVDFTGVVTVGDEQITFTNNTPCTFKLKDRNIPIGVGMQGQGFANVRVRAEGRPKPGVGMVEDRGLRVTRRWTNPDGELLPSGPIRVGDLIYVEVTLEATNGSSRIPYVAITDILPGGLEVEHPRLASSSQFSKPSTAQSERVEFLDDRVLIFATAKSSSRTFRYALRATMAGEFIHPGIEASSMYAPELRSHGEEDRCLILE